MLNNDRISAGLKVLAFYFFVNGASSLAQTISFAVSPLFNVPSYGQNWSLLISNSMHTFIYFVGAFLGFMQPGFIKRLCGILLDTSEKESEPVS